MDGCFPFYYAPGSFLSQNFRHFDPTLAGPILDQVEPSGILLNPSDSPACVVSESDSLTTGDPSSSCEMIILHNNSHGGIIRVCMRIEEGIKQCVTSPYFHSASLVICSLSLMKRTHFSELSTSRFSTYIRKALCKLKTSKWTAR